MKKKYYVRPLKKRSRTIPFRARYEEKGKLYRCWNCGFICSTLRDDLTGEGASDGVEPINYSETIYSSPTGNGLATMDGGLEHFQVAPSIGADGEEDAPELHFRPSVMEGCPFCGCRNWRGDF